ncbi:hypothetical protein PFISCL1PPCAC_27147 [Pristionchus fissidentatus]|uniref:Uncharacterized protein n=1 Tax=Pristionchus fissidentatus TaxID=1538716 RepID=A0AAV5WYY2_9BILA|nr:hypothetical protein PFISCL1PPCAC_27147 [Pristionchus fissidentatus]
MMKALAFLFLLSASLVLAARRPKHTDPSQTDPSFSASSLSTSIDALSSDYIDFGADSEVEVPTITEGEISSLGLYPEPGKEHKILSEKY